jgi:hypothetical protein
VIDAAVAVMIVALILILEPGVAVAALLALILLAVCATSYLVGRRQHRPRVRRGARRAPRSTSARSRRR